MTTIAQETLDFLSDLSKNNNREWFDKNRKRYEAAKKNVEAFVQELLPGMTAFEPTLAGLTAKDCTFRIFRDVRFSKDKSPFKTNMGAYVSRGGKKSPMAGYYLHIQPGGAFIAGGIYGPPSDVLNNIRQEIDYNAEEFKALLNDKTFKKLFGELAGEKLKTAPKNYPKDHPEIELLKHKSYLMVHEVKDKEVVSKDFGKTVLSTFEAMLPLNNFLNRTFD